MSDPIPAPSEGQPGEGKGDSCLIEHSEAVVDDMDALLASPDISDVIFVVEEERFHAHKTVLAARCEYFKAMLYGGLKESSEAEVKLEGTSCLPFRTLLRYIYTGKVVLSAFKVEELMVILQLAHEYRLLKIQQPIVGYLKRTVDISNVFTILRGSMLLFDELSECCMQFADQHTSEVLASKDFLTLQQKAVKEMLSRDSFYVPEIDIFKAICEWVRAQQSVEGKEVLVESFISKKCLRLDLLSPEELLCTVRCSELFEANSSVLEKFILDALARRCQGTVSDIRGPAVLDENVATTELGAVVVEGENMKTLLSGAQGNSDSTSLTRHRIGQPEGIIVQLGRPYTINCVTLKMGRCGVDTNYRYAVEVSMDRQHWQRVGFHDGCQCLPVHEVVFHARLVRYIRVLGSRSNNEYFSLVSFKALSSKKRARLNSPTAYIGKK